MSGGTAVELARQIRRLMKDPIPGISVAPSGNDPHTWLVKLAGPRGTPYEGGWFDVELKFPSDFPRSMPQGTYRTEIWHPNVCKTGRICISMDRNDTSGCAVECILMGLHMLLATPNPDSPLNRVCAEQYKRDHAGYRQEAARKTRLYAM